MTCGNVSDVLYARWQMGLSLAFHIVFAAIGMAMPILMVLAEWRARRTGDREHLELARRWAKGTAVLFAVGAVSGTVLSFELGLLFPTFMRHAGPIVGFPFSMEGFAFFTEAIFLGLYLYGWERLSPRVHLASGVVVAASGTLSAVFVTFVNAWMNAPRGFRVEGAGATLRLVEIDPSGALRSPAAAHEIVHMVLAAYMATAIAVAGVHAWGLLRGRRATFHRKALGLALWVAVPSSLAQPLVGHWAGQVVAELQPAKLAALEQHEKTMAWAPITLGPIKIPGALSVLAKNRPSAVVTGLEEFPRADWPHPVVRPAFQGMVAIGAGLAALCAWALFMRVRKKAWPEARPFLRALVVAAPLGFVAIELGWIVTEVGRQPFTIYGVLRTAETVTPMPGLVVPFVIFTVVYAGLALACVAVLRHHIRQTTTEVAPDAR
jgi:cytochrome d ubiquinol oxidase subunit I